MTKHFVVYLTYGVTVQVDEDIDPNTDAGYTIIKDLAASKMFDNHGVHEVITNAEYEIEDITEEYDYLRSI